MHENISIMSRFDRSKTAIDMLAIRLMVGNKMRKKRINRVINAHEDKGHF